VLILVHESIGINASQTRSTFYIMRAYQMANNALYLGNIPDLDKLLVVEEKGDRELDFKEVMRDEDGCPKACVPLFTPLVLTRISSNYLRQNIVFLANIGVLHFYNVLKDATTITILHNVPGDHLMYSTSRRASSWYFKRIRPAITTDISEAHRC
jgi:hypothetical protein